jgi:ATP-dependent RNA helicase DDX56/DBP9
VVGKIFCHLRKKKVPDTQCSYLPPERRKASHLLTNKLNTAATMKRKLDGNDVPAPVVEEAKTQESNSFADLGLDARLLQAIAKQNFKAPTLVQKKAIPLAIKGRDVLARAKTGSGKTAAYLLPILHAILKQKEVC